MRNEFYYVRLALYAIATLFIVYFIGAPIVTFIINTENASASEKIVQSLWTLQHLVYGVLKSLPFAFAIWLVRQSRIGYVY